LTGGSSQAAVPQGPLGVLAGSAAAIFGGVAPLAAIGTAGVQPRRVPTTGPVAAAQVATAQVLSSKVTVYLTSAGDDGGAGLESPSLLDSETLSEVAAGLASISGGTERSTGQSARKE
jgi:hypothetical protein